MATISRTGTRGGTRKKKRHWTPVPIDSAPWWRAVRKLGVRRKELEVEFERAADEAGGPDRIDSFQPGASTAEAVAARFLLYPRVPTYATLLYVTHNWSSANRSLKEWIVCQFATLIAGGQREAAIYTLWVDYFEVPERAAFVFPRLLRLVPRLAWGPVLGASGPVPWPVKREAYHAAARDPALHAGLARGLAGSFYDGYGSVEPVQARDLLRAITVEQEDVRVALEAVTTRPTRWELLAVIEVDSSDPRFARWVPEERRAELTFLALMRRTSELRVWVPGAEIFSDGEPIGRLVHWSFPFDAEVRHLVYGAWAGPNLIETVLFRVEGDARVARARIGRGVEAWPAGLRPSNSPG